MNFQDEWIFFKYPWPEIHGVRDDLETSLHRTPDNCTDKTGSLEMIPENCPLDPQGRLSISLDDQVGIKKMATKSQTIFGCIYVVLQKRS